MRFPSSTQQTLLLQSLMIQSSHSFSGLRVLGASSATRFASGNPSIPDTGALESQAMAATVLQGNVPLNSTSVRPPLELKELEPFVPSNRSLRSALGLSPASLSSRNVNEKQILPRIVGHRGALFDYLENTRPSFLRCAELGCDGVELDVFLTNDGNLVVYHGSGSDSTPGSLLHHCLPTSTASKVSIVEMNYEQICRLQFNSGCEDFPCPEIAIQTAQVPLLSEVLQDLKGTGLQVKIELKGPTGSVVAPVLDLVESMNMVDQCCYSSFHHEWLRRLRDLRPNSTQYPTGALFESGGGSLPTSYLEMARDCGATEIHIPYSLCTVDTVRDIHRNGFGSMVWFRGPVGMAADMLDKYWDVGNEDEACYQALIDTGVQELCLNRPHVAVDMVKRYNAVAFQEQKRA